MQLKAYFCPHMAFILCIETATNVCSVAIAHQGDCIITYNHSMPNVHAAELHSMVEKILQETGLTLSKLSAIAISKGPGSYTGLRVGVSAAKGYAYALGIPLIAINTLSSLTAIAKKQISDPKALFIPMIDARRMEVYCAVLNSNLQFLQETQALIIEHTSFSALLPNANVYFFGNGAEKCKSILNQTNFQFLEDISCCAAGLSQLAHEAYIKKEFVNLAYFEPNYLKDFIGTQAKNKLYN